MNVTKNDTGRFGVYVSGRWIGNIKEANNTEEELEEYFKALYPGEDVIVWDNQE